MAINDIIFSASYRDEKVLLVDGKCKCIMQAQYFRGERWQKKKLLQRWKLKINLSHLWWMLQGPACFFLFFLFSFPQLSSELESHSRLKYIIDDLIWRGRKNLVFKATAGADRVQACVMWRTGKSWDFYKWHVVWNKRGPDTIFT